MPDRNLRNIAGDLQGRTAEAAHAEAIDFLKRSFAG